MQGEIFRMRFGKTLNVKQISQTVTIRDSACFTAETYVVQRFSRREENIWRPSVFCRIVFQFSIENGIITTLIIRSVINVDLRNGDSFYFRYNGEQIICMIKADSAKTFQEIINAKQGSPFMEKPGGSSSAC